MNDIQKTLETLVGAVVKESPELNVLRAKFQAGELNEQDALQQMMEIVAKNPEVSSIIEMQRQAPTVRLPRIDPLTEAALIERAQFDGDIPELRSGRMTPGNSPAVPVSNLPRNPVAAGMMLTQASQDMQKKIDEHETKRLAVVDEMIQKALPAIANAGEMLSTINTPDIFALAQGTQKTDPPDYRRGELPVPVKVPVPSAAILATLAPEDKHKAAWKFLSTTQGRKSAMPVIAQLIIEDLSTRGFDVTHREPTKSEVPPLCSHKWTILMSGPSSTQPAFSFIDIAAKVIAAGIRSKLPKEVKSFILEVSSVDRISDRVVGWSAQAFHA